MNDGIDAKILVVESTRDWFINSMASHKAVFLERLMKEGLIESHHIDKLKALAELSEGAINDLSADLIWKLQQEKDANI